MSKQYSYKDLIEAYIATKRRYIHPDFTNYYVGLFNELADLFNIHFVSEELVEGPKFIPEQIKEVLDSNPILQGRSIDTISLLMLFNETISSYLAICTPFENFLTGATIYTIGVAYGDTFDRLSQEYKDTHLDLLDTLFKIMYGETETVVTSEQLLVRGVDDSKEPKRYDYLDYL